MEGLWWWQQLGDKKVADIVLDMRPVPRNGEKPEPVFPARMPAMGEGDLCIYLSLSDAMNRRRT